MNAKTDTIQTFNPATGETGEAFPAHTLEQAQAIAADCARAQMQWRKKPIVERGWLMHTAAQVMRAKADSAVPVGAACFDKTTSAATWVTVASVVRNADSPNTVIRRFGAISELLTA